MVDTLAPKSASLTANANVLLPEQNTLVIQHMFDNAWRELVVEDEFFKYVFPVKAPKGNIRVKGMKITYEQTPATPKARFEEARLLKHQMETHERDLELVGRMVQYDATGQNIRAGQDGRPQKEHVENQTAGLTKSVRSHLLMDGLKGLLNANSQVENMRRWLNYTSGNVNDFDTMMSVVNTMLFAAAKKWDFAKTLMHIKHIINATKTKMVAVAPPGFPAYQANDANFAPNQMAIMGESEVKKQKAADYRTFAAISQVDKVIQTEVFKTSVDPRDRGDTPMWEKKVIPQFWTLEASNAEFDPRFIVLTDFQKEAWAWISVADLLQKSDRFARQAFRLDTGTDPTDATDLNNWIATEVTKVKSGANLDYDILLVRPEFGVFAGQMPIARQAEGGYSIGFAYKEGDSIRRAVDDIKGIGFIVAEAYVGTMVEDTEGVFVLPAAVPFGQVVNGSANIGNQPSARQQADLYAFAVAPGTLPTAKHVDFRPSDPCHEKELAKVLNIPIDTNTFSLPVLKSGPRAYLKGAGYSHDGKFAKLSNTSPIMHRGLGYVFYKNGEPLRTDEETGLGNEGGQPSASKTFRQFRHFPEFDNDEVEDKLRKQYQVKTKQIP